MVDIVLWPPPSEPGDSGDDVHALQTKLREHGWYMQQADSKYGPLVEQAVQRLQRASRSNGHDPGPIDGRYGDRTRTAAIATFT